MLKRAYLLIALFVVYFSDCNAQMLEYFGQYVENQYLINSATIGKNGFMDLDAGARKQWDGINESPETFFFAANFGLNSWKPKEYPIGGLRMGEDNDVLKLAKEEGERRFMFGLGALVYYDKYGAFETVNVKLAGAVHYRISERYKVSLGLGALWTRDNFIQENASKLVNPNDPTYLRYANDYENRKFYNFDGGVYLYSDRLNLGYSITTVDNRYVVDDRSNVSKLYLSHLLMGSYMIPLSHKLELRPTLLIHIVPPAPTVLDFNLLLYYKRRIWVGGSYISNNSWIAMIGARFVDKYKVSYSYSMIENDLSRYSNGSHEVIIGFQIR
ncbi:PorP/SprF family type IX secretion system membrane protein [Aureibacter tunicatorum]|uniref:Type IX secretion system PorP/SprF family membrane protein n=1 Tax=Aureibacter tunicatorum TaxID=866807 RepID=A0AAE3XJP2_9BACT|nr:PorP/SprF family type IX secretion system membrane protein [Aureibacter tunicatorum]MDR6237637.1 type IX secretion system PorP/SprF family membrane protein [Aureibacter tunicatorum]BDD02672.1 hypothetical protein AUTU_01550 [Aureibacter tunicatorum]